MKEAKMTTLVSPSTKTSASTKSATWLKWREDTNIVSAEIYHFLLERNEPTDILTIVGNFPNTYIPLIKYSLWELVGSKKIVNLQGYYVLAE